MGNTPSNDDERRATMVTVDDDLPVNKGSMDNRPSLDTTPVSTASRQQVEGLRIGCEDLLDRLPGHETTMRTIDSDAERFESSGSPLSLRSASSIESSSVAAALPCQVDVAQLSASDDISAQPSRHKSPTKDEGISSTREGGDNDAPDVDMYDDDVDSAATAILDRVLHGGNMVAVTELEDQAKHKPACWFDDVVLAVDEQVERTSEDGMPVWRGLQTKASVVSASCVPHDSELVCYLYRQRDRITTTVDLFDCIHAFEATSAKPGFAIWWQADTMTNKAIVCELLKHLKLVQGAGSTDDPFVWAQGDVDGNVDDDDARRALPQEAALLEYLTQRVTQLVAATSKADLLRLLCDFRMSLSTASAFRRWWTVVWTPPAEVVQNRLIWLGLVGGRGTKTAPYVWSVPACIHRVTEGELRPCDNEPMTDDMNPSFRHDASLRECPAYLRGIESWFDVTVVRDYEESIAATARSYLSYSHRVTNADHAVSLKLATLVKRAVTSPAAWYDDVMSFVALSQRVQKVKHNGLDVWRAVDVPLEISTTPYKIPREGSLVCSLVACSHNIKSTYDLAQRLSEFGDSTFQKWWNADPSANALIMLELLIKLGLVARGNETEIDDEDTDSHIEALHWSTTTTHQSRDEPEPEDRANRALPGEAQLLHFLAQTPSRLIVVCTPVELLGLVGKFRQAAPPTSPFRIWWMTSTTPPLPAVVRRLRHLGVLRGAGYERQPFQWTFSALLPWFQPALDALIYLPASLMGAEQTVQSETPAVSTVPFISEHVCGDGENVCSMLDDQSVDQGNPTGRDGPQKEATAEQASQPSHDNEPTEEKYTKSPEMASLEDALERFTTFALKNTFHVADIVGRTKSKTIDGLSGSHLAEAIVTGMKKDPRLHFTEDEKGRQVFKLRDAPHIANSVAQLSTNVANASTGSPLNDVAERFAASALNDVAERFTASALKHLGHHESYHVADIVGKTKTMAIGGLQKDALADAIVVRMKQDPRLQYVEDAMDRRVFKRCTNVSPLDQSPRHVSPRAANNSPRGPGVASKLDNNGIERVEIHAPTIPSSVIAQMGDKWCKTAIEFLTTHANYPHAYFPVSRMKDLTAMGGLSKEALVAEVVKHMAMHDQLKYGVDETGRQIFTFKVSALVPSTSIQQVEEPPLSRQAIAVKALPLASSSASPLMPSSANVILVEAIDKFTACALKSLEEIPLYCVSTIVGQTKHVDSRPIGVPHAVFVQQIVQGMQTNPRMELQQDEQSRQIGFVWKRYSTPRPPATSTVANRAEQSIQPKTKTRQTESSQPDSELPRPIDVAIAKGIDEALDHLQSHETYSLNNVKERLTHLSNEERGGESVSVFYFQLVQGMVREKRLLYEARGIESGGPVFKLSAPLQLGEEQSLLSGHQSLSPPTLFVSSPRKADAIVVEGSLEQLTPRNSMSHSPTVSGIDPSGLSCKEETMTTEDASSHRLDVIAAKCKAVALAYLQKNSFYHVADIRGSVSQLQPVERSGQSVDHIVNQIVALLLQDPRLEGKTDAKGRPILVLSASKPASAAPTAMTTSSKPASIASAVKTVAAEQAAIAITYLKTHRNYPNAYYPVSHMVTNIRDSKPGERGGLSLYAFVEKVEKAMGKHEQLEATTTTDGKSIFKLNMAGGSGIRMTQPKQAPLPSLECLASLPTSSLTNTAIENARTPQPGNNEMEAPAQDLANIGTSSAFLAPTAPQISPPLPLTTNSNLSTPPSNVMVNPLLPTESPMPPRLMAWTMEPEHVRITFIETVSALVWVLANDSVLGTAVEASAVVAIACERGCPPESNLQLLQLATDITIYIVDCNVLG
ncbi:hypothetical protein As57867_014853, partial [Aphanomyces stellatus]